MANISDNETRCSLFDNPDLCHTVIIVKRIAACISLLGCILMLVNIFVYKKLNTFIQRIILYMTIASLLSAVAYIMGDLLEDGPFCTFQGFVTNFADWSVLMWILLITITLYLVVIWDHRLDKKEWVFHIVCWGTPLIASCIPFIDDNHYGPSGAWCWIDYTIWRFAVWYIPLFLLMGVIVLLNAHMVYLVHQRAKNTGGIYNQETEESHRQVVTEMKSLRLYPFMYLLLNIFPLCNRIYDAVMPHQANFILTLLHAISCSSQGTLNAFVFGFNKQTLEEFRWSNFKVHLRNLCSRNTTVIGEYDVQIDDDHPMID
ncbi:G-protein coupled receptor 157-like [Watersipora subatra]|uniref:G-protein coupled receptor 157-like n=1 Tax=Watersipora subatra TaxID=2589382 RepID=UPI00355B4519